MLLTISLSIGAVILFTVVKSFIINNSAANSLNKWYSYFKGSEKGKPVSASTSILSIFASLNGGFMVLGLVQIGYEGGLSGYILGCAYILGVVLLFFLMRKAEKNNKIYDGIFGVDSILLNRYGPKTVRAFYFITGVVFAGVLGGQLIAISNYLKIYGDIINFTIVIVIGVAGTMAYTIRHGFKGVLANDTIQSVVELGVAFVFPISIFYFIYKSAGTVSFNLSTDFSSIGGVYGPLYPLFGTLFLMLSFSTRADVWQRVINVNRKGQLLILLGSGILLTFYYFMMTTAGVLIKQNSALFNMGNNPNIGAFTIDLTGPVMHNLTTFPFLNIALQIFCLSGVLIAILSSIDSYLNLTSTSLTKFSLWNTIPKVKTEDLSELERQALLDNTRVATVFVGVIAGIFAILIPDIVDLMSASFSIIGILIPIVVTGIFSQRKFSDMSGALPIWASFITLVIAVPLIGKSAFIPAFVMGGVLFAVLIFRDSHRKLVP